MSANEKEPPTHSKIEASLKRLREEGFSVSEQDRARRGAAEPAEGVEWLVMLYLAGDNNLTEEMVLALQALMMEGAPEGDRIVAQLDPSGLGLPTQTYDFHGRLDGDGDPKLHLHEYLADYPVDETNTGNPDALAGFVIWAHNRYPTAKYHLLILSGHGSGTTEDFLLKDESAMDSVTIDELRLALQMATNGTRRKIDVLGMDACFMSMFEVACQISPCVDILIGAEGLEPQFGWPYHRILRAAKAHRQGGHPAMSPDQLARVIVRNYVEFYSDYDRSAGRSVDLSAINLSKMNDLNEAMFGEKGLATVLSDQVKRNHDRITLAHWYAQTYKADQFVDLHDLCVQLYRRFDDVEDVKQACRKVVKALDGGWEALDKPGSYPPGGGSILLSGCSGFAYQFSHGLSIYFPWAVVSSDYKKCATDGNLSAWSTFLEEQVRATAREPRFNEPPDASPPGVDALARILAKRQVALILDVLAPKAQPSRGPAFEDIARLLQRDDARDGFREAFRSRIRARVDELPEMPDQDKLQEIIGKYTGPASKYTGPASKYTGPASRYTGPASRYTGPASKYAAGITRSATDREQSVKNLPSVIGKAYWPQPPV